MPGSSERGVLLHLPLVRSVAYALWRRVRHVEMEDIVSAGVIGLIEADKRYDCERGTSFASFAYRRIEGAMIDEIRRYAAPPSLLHQEAATGPLSLSAPIQDERGLTLMDVTVDRFSPEPSTHVVLGELLRAIRCLPDREREMLKLSLAGHTVVEIADLHGCSRSRVSQLLIQARLRLEERMAA
jgi:RNA polymerase sigma factor (sigma-70 family)